jgi:phosphoglycerate dehydrogenase-like enzyme
MKPSSVLTNTSQGGVMDETALIEALERGEIAGAGLDVFAAEPQVPARLCGLQNVVLTPHSADLTPSAAAGLVQHAAGVSLRLLDGEELVGDDNITLLLREPSGCVVAFDIWLVHS